MSVSMKKGDRIAELYIDEYIKTSEDGSVESYWVKGDDDDDTRFLMKLYADTEKMNLFDSLERGMSVPLTYLEYRVITLKGKSRLCTLHRYVEGKRLSDMIAEGERFTWAKAKRIITSLLLDLKCMHKIRPAIIHNNITTRHIIIPPNWPDIEIDLVGTKHLSYLATHSIDLPTAGLNNWYRAPETFCGIYNVQTDIFSVGVVLYTMLNGLEPWAKNAQSVTPDEHPFIIKRLREEGERIVDKLSIADDEKCILRKMIAIEPCNRYRNVSDVLDDLTDGYTERPSAEQSKDDDDDFVFHTFEESCTFCDSIKTCEGGGFADVAGMDEVKKMLNKNVMFVLQNKEKAAKYRLKAPNGALFYGPPGCGKTYIAQKFAEESHLNFMMVKASDVGSVYLHGSQKLIAELFKEAAEKAPSVICFDELDGMVPNRATNHSENISGEVNEFLSQLNNCSERGIFVIGTTNRPEKIDPAILRTGRLDKMIYIPIPDYEARKSLFRHHLKDRYVDDSIDFDELARLSEGFVASDICFIADESALDAAIADVPISQHILIEVMKKSRRSVPKEKIAEYEHVHLKLERQERCKVGFK